MKRILIKFTYEKYIIIVPNAIGENIYDYQKEFDKWLYDKKNNHGLWIIKNNKKIAVSFDVVDFVNFLNNKINDFDVKIANDNDYGKFDYEINF